jgi:hypothetical protein
VPLPVRLHQSARAPVPVRLHSWRGRLCRCICIERRGQQRHWCICIKRRGRLCQRQRAASASGSVPPLPAAAPVSMHQAARPPLPAAALVRLHQMARPSPAFVHFLQVLAHGPERRRSAGQRLPRPGISSDAPDVRVYKTTHEPKMRCNDLGATTLQFSDRAPHCARTAEHSRVCPAARCGGSVRGAAAPT